MKYDIRVSTEEDMKKLPWYDHTTLSAVERCPRYAILAYRNNKRIPGYKPSDALLAGGAAHKFFAAWNIFNNHSIHHDFKPEELENYYAAADVAEDEGKRTTFALEALYTHSDGLPEGGRKGSAKIEDSCLFWSKMQDHGYEIIATEQRFCITINDSWRYTGLMDCLQRTKSGVIIPVEYKTTTRIDKGYESKWYLSNQITGYHIAMRAYEEAGLLFGKLADFVDVEATQLPRTKSDNNVPHMRTPYEREKFHYEHFFRWAEGKIAILNKEDNSNAPWDAETHETCYQFNSVCAFLYNFCNYDCETREEIFHDQLETHIWDPNGEAL